MDDHSVDAWLGPRGRSIAAAVLCTFVLVKLALLFAFALNADYVMAEHRHASVSLRLDPLYQTLTPFKTALFVAFYGFAFWLDDDAVGIMRTARLQTAVIGFIIVWCVYAVSRNLGRSRVEALFNAAVLLAFATFMERAFRVRTEPLAAMFAMLSLLVLTRTARQRPNWQVLLGGIVVGLAFLSTQKTVYVLLGLGLGLLAQQLSWLGLLQGIRRGAIFTLGWAIALLAYAIYLGWSGESVGNSGLIPVLAE